LTIRRRPPHGQASPSSKKTRLSKQAQSMRTPWGRTTLARAGAGLVLSSPQVLAASPPACAPMVPPPPVAAASAACTGLALSSALPHVAAAWAACASRVLSSTPPVFASPLSACACRATRASPGTTLALHEDLGPSTPDSRSSGCLGGGTTLAIFASSSTGVITQCVAPFLLGLRSRYVTRPSASIESLPTATRPAARPHLGAGRPPVP